MTKFIVENINRIIGIPYCIYCNYTSEHDCWRWRITDETGKVYVYFNHYRNNKLTYEFRRDTITSEELEAITRLAQSYSFIDYSDEEKQEINLKYANHPCGYSLMCAEDATLEERQAILSRLAHVVPHPTDENGLPIPMARDLFGNIVEWPRVNNRLIPTHELDTLLNQPMQ